MDNATIARVLQNMIEEAEENLDALAERMKGYENLEHLDERRVQLKEAMELEAELGGPLLSEDKPSVPKETIADWEKRMGKEYPDWAPAWTYDGYGECWEATDWKDRKEYYAQERNQPRGSAAWDFQYEPLVRRPEDTPPKWGDGPMLSRAVKE